MEDILRIALERTDRYFKVVSEEKFIHLDENAKGLSVIISFRSEKHNMS